MTSHKPKHFLLAMGLFAALALTLGARSAAADGDEGARGRAKSAKKAEAAPAKPTRKVKSYDFEGDDIRGDGILPSGDNIFVPRPMEHGSLIRLRASFLPEIVRAADEVR